MLLRGVNVQIALVVILVVGTSSWLPAARVGDGSEYYAYFFSWYLESAPWLSEKSLQAYEVFTQSGQVAGMVGSSDLSNQWPLLSTHEGEWDFNHFPFYSLIPAVFGKFVALFGFVPNPHMMFLVFHAILLWLCLVIVNKNLGRVGAVSAGILILSSPAVWFVNHVHTEFFTVTLTIAATALAMKSKWLSASIVLSVVSLQNISFLAVSLVLIGIHFAVLLKVKHSPKKIDLVLAFVALFVGFMHPAYYLVRYSVMTSTSIGGGQAPLIHLLESYIWFIDPDIGLLANWPVGLLLLAVVLVRAAKLKGLSGGDKNVYFAIYVVAFCVVSLAAQASTTNLNSGATPSVARYSLWYLCLFLPITVLAVKHVSSRVRDSTEDLSTILIASGLVVTNLMSNTPLKVESYTSPTPLSYAVQKFAPYVYTPPVEIFIERFSGFGEAIWGSDVGVVLGPDCNKIALLSSDSGRMGLANQFGCHVSPEDLVRINNLRQISGKSGFQIEFLN